MGPVSQRLRVLRQKCPVLMDHILPSFERHDDIEQAALGIAVARPAAAVVVYRTVGVVSMAVFFLSLPTYSC